MDAVLYIHGKGGSVNEAEYYKSLFPLKDIIGIDYKADKPWIVCNEIQETISKIKRKYDSIILIGNSIGAYFAMNANIEKYISHAFFISPVVNMEKMIMGLMKLSNVTEHELQKQSIIHTDFGEDLSWEYLCYVREHPIKWNVTTDILYGSNDTLISIDTIEAFIQTHRASLTIMEGGEHWFHTEKQMQFISDWIQNKFEF